MPKDGRTKTFLTRLTPNEHEKLRRVAASMGRSAGELIRKWINESEESKPLR